VIELNPDLIFEPLRQIPLVVALPPGHPLAKERRLGLRHLANEPFVLFKRSSSAVVPDWILSLCHEAGFDAHVTKFADRPQLILELVASGFGVALLPTPFQRFPSDVVFRPLPSSTPKLHLSLAWRRDNNSSLLKAFLEILRPRVKKLNI
jgi:DNA-binding transcriptional LysR family regulator